MKEWSKDLKNPKRAKMKKTVEELKQIIKEELMAIIAEDDMAMDRPPIDYSVLAADPLEEGEELYYEDLE